MIYLSIFMVRRWSSMLVRGNYLFNINASYDYGAYLKADFPELSDLIAHMDRLGIDGAAVHSVVARDFQATAGNKKLINDIENTAGAKERIMPVFCIKPSMYYDIGERDYLLEMVSSRKVNMLAVFCNAKGFTMRECFKLFDELRPYKLTILVEFNTEFLEEVENLAHDFPDMLFIIRSSVWTEMHIANLMWKCPNIATETSWLFSAAGYGMFVNNFGSERLFFGADTKNQQASSLSTLEYAQINDEAYGLIASGNAARIFNEAKSACDVFSHQHPPAKFNNSFWQPFIEKRKIDDLMMIDAHGHSGGFMPSCFTPHFDEAQSFDYMSRYMDRMGVKTTVASSIGGFHSNSLYYNRLAREAAKPYGDKFFGYYSINPHHMEFNTKEIFEEELAKGYFIGFKAHPPTSRCFMTDPGYIPMLEFADTHHLPVQMHCWGKGGPGSPEDVEKVAKIYKNVQFLLGHGGGDDDGRLYAEQIIKQYDNVYIELCASFCVLTRQLDDTVKEIGADKVVFGSDGYGHDLAYEVGSLLSHDLNDEQIRLIAGKNMKRILAMRR